MNHTPKTKVRPGIHILWLLSLAAFILLVYCGEALSAAAYDSLLFAAKKLVPSMFLFAVATGLVSALPAPTGHGRLPLLKLPTSAAIALAIGLFSGFPMGAYAAKRLWDRGVLPQKTAEHLAAFANNASFGFLYFTVGALLGDTKWGVLLFLSGTLASLFVGILFMPNENARPDTPSLSEPPSLFTLISDAIVSAANAMLTLCGYLALFGALAKALSLIALPPSLFTAAILFFEPTAAVRHLATLDLTAALPLIAFALGFSGFSILLQSLSVWQGQLRFLRVCLLRLTIGLLSALLTSLFVFLSAL